MNLKIEDQLSELRCKIKRSFVSNAKSKNYKLYDDNTVIFSHQDVTAVAGPFRLENSKDHQPLISLFVQGKSDYSISDDYYIIEAVVTEGKPTIEKPVLINEDGVKIQSLTRRVNKKRVRDVEVVHACELTDFHTGYKKDGTKTLTVSGEIFGYEFEVTVDVKKVEEVKE